MSMLKPMLLEYPYTYLSQASSRWSLARRSPPLACQLVYWPVKASSRGYS